MTGPDFENVYYKNNIAQGVTMQSNYMGVGGTNWGWLPDPDVYTSYDYGAAISETGEIGTPSDPNDIAGSKYGENKLINDFETSVVPLAETQAGAAPTPSNSAVATMARYNPSDGAEFFYLRQADATSTATVSTSLDNVDLDEAAGFTYDDTNAALDYSGDWTHAGASSGYTGGDYDQTESWCHAGRREHDGGLHRHRGGLDRAEEHQRRHRRRLPRRQPGRPRSTPTARRASCSSRCCSARPA